MTFVILVAALALSMMAAPAFGQNCLQDEYTAAGQQQSLNCTANDVRVAKVINVRDLNGANVTSCTPGPFPFIADFLVTTSSSSSRSNIGLYFSDKDVHDQATALTGMCEDNIISDHHTCPDVTINGNTIHPTATCGSSHYEELDPQTTKIQGKTTPTPDNCGDSSSNDPSVCLDANNHVVSCSKAQLANCTVANNCFAATQVITAELPNFQCPSDVASGTELQLPNCTSWQVPGSTIECQSDPNQGWPYSTAAIPGSPSKCNCATIPLGITVQNPGVTVAKNCNLGDTAITTDVEKCDFGATVEGGDVTYNVTVTNKSNFGDSIVDQICDSQYGTISDDGQSGQSACAAGSFCKAHCTGVDTPFTGCTGAGTANPGTSCIASTTCATPLTANGSPASCSFTVNQPESQDITNVVKVSGHGSSSGSFGPTPSNSVEVISGEAPSTATITKGTLGNQGACATMRFDVDVENTSSPDETITLSALTDSVFGPVNACTNAGCTNTGGNIILGTNCGLASGVGTLSGVTVTGFPGGAYGTVSPSSGYKCAFDAQFCSTSLDIHGCFQNTDKVTGTIAGDENESVTVTANSLTVTECISQQ